MQSDYKSLFKELLKHFLLFLIVLTQILYKLFDGILNILAYLTLKLWQIITRDKNKKDSRIIKIDNNERRGFLKKDDIEVEVQKGASREYSEAELFLKNYFIVYGRKGK